MFDYVKCQTAVSSDQLAVPLSPLGGHEPLRAITESLGPLYCDRVSFTEEEGSAFNGLFT